MRANIIIAETRDIAAFNYRVQQVRRPTRRPRKSLFSDRCHDICHLVVKRARYQKVGIVEDFGQMRRTSSALRLPWGRPATPDADLKRRYSAHEAAEHGLVRHARLAGKVGHQRRHLVSRNALPSGSSAPTPVTASATRVRAIGIMALAVTPSSEPSSERMFIRPSMPVFVVE
jgi:hypothetical protein